MNAVDFLVLGVLVCSVLIGLYRGFLRESIALIAWLGGMWLAWRYAPILEPKFGGMLADPPASTWAARASILLAVLLVGWLIAAVLDYLMRHSTLSITVDRVLGMTFGALRGAVVVAIFVLLGRSVELDEVAWWRESSILPYAGELAGWIESFAETGMQILEAQAR